MKYSKDYYKVMALLIITEIVWAIVKPILIVTRFIKELFIAIFEWLYDNEVFTVLLGLLVTAFWIFLLFVMMRATGWTH